MSWRTDLSASIRSTTAGHLVTVAPAADGDVARVQRHVAALDALGGQRAQRGEVLGEADGER